MSLDCAEIESFGAGAEEQACRLVHQAYDGGINFFDTAHSKPVCEKRLGAALHGIRHNVFLATTTDASSVHELRSDVNESLATLDTDYIDLYQLENSLVLPTDKTQDGLYRELSSLKKKGTVRHIGLVTENYDLAVQAIESGLYETVQIPFNMLTGEDALSVVRLCHEREVGCIAMQPLCGGLVSNIPLAFGFLHQYEGVVPLWGIHTPDELLQILYFNDHPPVVDEQFMAEAEKIRTFFN